MGPFLLFCLLIQHFDKLSLPSIVAKVRHLLSANFVWGSGMGVLSRSKSVCLCVAFGTALSGCNLDLIEYGQRLEDEERMAKRVMEYSPTSFAAMPTTGSASFEGYGNLYIDRVREAQGDGLFAIGDATLTADFEAGTLTGEISNLVGATNVRLTEAGNIMTGAVEALDVAGQINLGLNESIIGNDEGTKTSRPNDWSADYSGDFIADGETYVLDGEIAGQFYGTRVNNPNTDFPIKAIAGGEELYSGSTATRQSDGAVFDSNLVIIAEN